MAQYEYETEYDCEIEMRKVKNIKAIMDIGYRFGMGISTRAEDSKKNIKKLNEEGTCQKN